MKTAWTVFASLCVLHLLGLLGLAAWAGATQRVDRERLAAVVDLFRQPIGDEEAQELDAQVEQDANEAAQRVEQTLDGAGSESIAERLESDQLRHDMTLRQLERTREEVRSLSRNLQLSQQRVEEQREALVAEQEALEERARELQEQLDDEGFRRAVALYESLPPRQTKQMFIELIDGQERDQVVAYLMAMQPRKASAVLREFTTVEEVAHAVTLTELLRARGSRLVEGTEDIG
ncbi:MAG: hypothetical protein WD294_09000 [Phycisphaeraceae bacterium]